MTPDQLDRTLDDLTRCDPAIDVHPQRDVDLVLERIFTAPTSRHSARGRAHRWPLAIAGLAAASVVALVAAPSLSGSHDAYAGWTHTPQALDAVRDHATAEQCRTWVGQTGPQRLPATPILTDLRGDWAMTLLTTSQGPVTCLLDQQPTREPNGGLAGPLSLPAKVPSSGLVLTWAGGTANDGEPIVRTIVGKVAPGITAVTLHTAAKGDVRAPLLDGWVLAWWPGETEGHDILEEDGRLTLGFDTVRLTHEDGSNTTLSASAVMVPTT